MKLPCDLLRLCATFACLARYRKLRRCGPTRPDSQAAWYTARHLVRWRRRYGQFTRGERILASLVLTHPARGHVARAAGLADAVAAS